jgi:hypothetical protein
MPAEVRLPDWLPRSDRKIVDQRSRLMDDIEADIAAEVKTVKSEVPPAKSADIKKANRMVTNTITIAHDDTASVLDHALAEVHALTRRADEAVTEHKRLLAARGQEIARFMEGVVLELNRMVDWLEQETPRLRDPQPADTPSPLMALVDASQPSPSSDACEPPVEEDSPPIDAERVARKFGANARKQKD